MRVIALTLAVGAMPFVFSAGAHAENEMWLDDYSRPVGFTYNAQAKIQTTYLWRGLYAGSANIQASANVGYGGLYADMWWNIGVTDWTFRTFLPEVDLTIGFARWGLDVNLLYIHNFNCGFFDMHNYPDKGNRIELNVRYTVSKKIPLSVLWATRVWASDAYLQGSDTVRAYSSYAEISYTQALPYDMSLYGAVGLTPWRSCYTFYQGGFAINNIDVRLRKDWSLSPHCGLMLMGQLCINPYALAVDLSSAAWNPSSPHRQAVNANIAVGVYLK